MLEEHVSTGKDQSGGAVSLLLRLLLAVFALFLIFVGFIAMISPIPFGLIMIVIGVALLAIAFPLLVRGFRKRWRWLDKVLDRLTPILPEWLEKPVERSDPEDEEVSAERSSKSLSSQSLSLQSLSSMASQSEDTSTCQLQAARAAEARRILMS